MWRGLLILLGLLVVTWFEFEVYPGHSYLQSETQLLVPMLERLDTPGFLSRDLVATNPTFSYTIYDEMTQSLHAGAKLTLEQALRDQQVLFRFAAVLGVFLIARALKVMPAAALLLSGSVNAITYLAAPNAFVTNPEATPVAFAVPLVLLAAGLLVNRGPLLAGLAGGLALLYDPVTAAAFWAPVIAASLFDRALRKSLRSIWPSLAVFGLILANLVQLQAGLGAGQELTGRLSEAGVQLTKLRTPSVWVSQWKWQADGSYLLLLILGGFALSRVWTRTDGITRWMTVGLAFSGYMSTAIAFVLMSAHLQVATEMTPAKNLSFSVVITLLLCGTASWHAAQKQRWVHSLPWMALLIAGILNAQLIDLLSGKVVAKGPEQPNQQVRALAQWAAERTWGSSLFQFPDAGKRNEPGMFRSLSRRALWADWGSGAIADYSDQAGQEWWTRWQNGMTRAYSPEELEKMLRLPVDYYVLEKSNALEGVKSVFANSEYVVYDAQDLREAREPLQVAHHASR